ncbi:MAG: hypothetical protein QOI78_596, partial [Actinomycetota bacterium]|nr:hypothetical protein [Actinomycetota bacterium]
FAGHGLLDNRSDLYLALPGAAEDRLHRSVRYDDIRREIVDTARACYGKVALLDCCFSGRALQGGMSGSVDLADHARVDGTYLMTATAETKKALAPPGETYTAFTGALVDKLEHGVPDGDDLLDMETLFYHVRSDLQARHFPVPQQRTRNDGQAIALVRNRHGVGRRTPAVSAEAVVRVLPQPPAGLAALLRRRPADMYAEVEALRADDQGGLGNQVLAASAALRADQEVAAIVDLLHRRGAGVDVQTVLTAAAQRPPGEVLRIVNALHDTDLPGAATQLVRAVGGGAFADAASLARLLQVGGRPEELGELLDAAFDAAQARSSLIGLVNALWVAGLRDEVDRLIIRAVSKLPGESVAALADELREVGREEAAFGLYAASAEAVATRPPEVVAQLCRAMTEADRAEESARVAQGVIDRAHNVELLLEVATTFWTTGQDQHADRTLTRAAEALSNTDVIALAAALRQRDHDDAAYRLCLRATVSRPVPAVLEIIAALREEGRPVDARRLAEETACEAPVATVVELLGRCGDRDRQRILQRTASREPVYCAELLAALVPVQPTLARQFTDLLTEAAVIHPDLTPIVIDRLDVRAKEQMFSSIVERGEAGALAALVRTLSADDAKTLVFLAVRGGKPELTSIADHLPDDGSGVSVRGYLSAQPLTRLGELVDGLRTAGLPDYADAVLDEIAASERGVSPIAADIAFLFETGQAEAGRTLVWKVLQDRSNTALKSMVAALHERNQPDALVAAADWVKETYVRIGPSNVDGILRQVGLGDYTNRKTWRQRRRQST